MSLPIPTCGSGTAGGVLADLVRAELRRIEGLAAELGGSSSSVDAVQAVRLANGFARTRSALRTLRFGLAKGGSTAAVRAFTQETTALLHASAERLAPGQLDAGSVHHVRLCLARTVYTLALITDHLRAHEAAAPTGHGRSTRLEEVAV